MSVPLFPLYGHPLAKMVQICQQVAERLHPSSGGVLFYGYPLAKAVQIASG